MGFLKVLCQIFLGRESLGADVTPTDLGLALLCLQFFHPVPPPLQGSDMKAHALSLGVHGQSGNQPSKPVGNWEDV